MMTSRSLTVTLLLGASLVMGGCTKNSDETDSDTSDTSETDSEPPGDPSPFSLTVTGAMDTVLEFDQPFCNNPAGSNNFSAIWRSGSGQHVFALLVQFLGDFQGEGSYDLNNATPRIKLQEEAGGQARFFQVDPSQGHTLRVNINHFTAEEQAWGSFTFSDMTGDLGDITVSPQPIPIWCPEING